MYAGRCSQLSNDSAGLRSAVDLVLATQQRSHALLVHLLGKSYSLEDVAFYLLGLLASLAAASLPVTRSARLPLLTLLATSLTLERCLPSYLQALLGADVLSRRLTIYIRRFFLAAAAATVLHAMTQHFRQQPKDSRWGMAANVAAVDSWGCLL